MCLLSHASGPAIVLCVGEMRGTTKPDPHRAYRLPEEIEKCLGYLKSHRKRDHKAVRNLGVVRLEHSSWDVS